MNPARQSMLSKGGSMMDGARQFIKRLVAPFRRRYLHVTLTLEGLFFCVVTLVVALAAINTSAQLLFLVFAMMCSLLVLSAVTAHATLRGLEVRRVPPRIVEARRVVRVGLRLLNRKRFIGTPCLRLSDSLDDGTRVGAAFSLYLPAGSERTETYECVFLERGIHRFETIEMATRFPFGLIERRLGRRELMQTLVLPATIDLRKALRAASNDLGERDSPARGRGTGLYSIRQYQPGEPSRDIHWKVSARTGRLMIREFESEERRRTTVSLDNRLHDPKSPDERERFERAIVLASSLVGVLVEDGHQVELLTASGKIPFDTGPAHVARCRRALATLQAEPMGKRPPTLRASTADAGEFVIAFDDRPSDEAEGRITLRPLNFKAELDEVRGMPPKSPQGVASMGDWGE